MKKWIIIDGGQTFEGNERQLDDCFGIRLNELDDWCTAHHMKYEILEEKPKNGDINSSRNM